MRSIEGLARVSGPRKTPDTGDRRLWAAVLARALRDIKEPVGEDCIVVRRDAEKWLRAQDWEVAGSRWVCNVLGIPWDGVIRYLEKGEKTYAEVEEGFRRIYQIP